MFFFARIFNLLKIKTMKVFIDGIINVLFSYGWLMHVLACALITPVSVSGQVVKLQYSATSWWIREAELRTVPPNTDVFLQRL